jgi:hypothetical protein
MATVEKSDVNCMVSRTYRHMQIPMPVCIYLIVNKRSQQNLCIQKVELHACTDEDSKFQDNER